MNLTLNLPQSLILTLTLVFMCHNGEQNYTYHKPEPDSFLDYKPQSAPLLIGALPLTLTLYR